MSFQKFCAKVTKLLKETIQLSEDLKRQLGPKSLINSYGKHEANSNGKETNCSIHPIQGAFKYN